MRLQTLVQLCFFSSLGLSLLLLFSLIYSSPLEERLVVHRRLDTIPDGYIETGRADQKQMIQFTIGILSNNMTGLKRKLYEVSTPNSPSYGQYLTKEEAEAYVRPDSNTTKLLNEWFQRNGVVPSTTSSSGNHVTINVSISRAERMLNTTFHTFNHTSSNKTITKTKQYSIPAALSEQVLFVHPITHFPPKLGPQPSRRPIVSVPSDTINSTCQEKVTPSCVSALYDIPLNSTVPENNTDKTAVVSLLDQAIQAKELAQYLGTFRPDVDISKVEVEIFSVDGGDNLQSPTNDNAEANLDVQTVLGLNPFTKVTGIAVSNQPEGDIQYLDAYNFLLGQQTLPTVVTASYGYNELDFPIETTIAICDAIAQLGTRGTTVIVSSGDGGVAGIRQVTCTTFISTFPASCPFALAVGSTNISTGIEVGASFTTGGFSTLFSRPDYQNQSVAAYRDQLGDTYAGLYNETGRAFPDISLVGARVAAQDNGQETMNDGTSASAPMAAAIISALNQRRAEKGLHSLGFINPLLYANNDVFKDIILGSNPGCDTPGFPAMPGWDPVSGLGTIQYQVLASVVNVTGN